MTRGYVKILDLDFVKVANIEKLMLSPLIIKRAKIVYIYLRSREPL